MVNKTTNIRTKIETDARQAQQAAKQLAAEYERLTHQQKLQRAGGDKQKIAMIELQREMKQAKKRAADLAREQKQLAKSSATVTKSSKGLISSLGNIKAGYIAIAAAAAGAIRAGSNAIKAYADIQGTIAGIEGEVADLRVATDNMVSDTALAKIVEYQKKLNLAEKQTRAIAIAGVEWARVNKTDMATGVNTVLDSVVKLNDRGLKQLGIYIQDLNKNKLARQQQILKAITDRYGDAEIAVSNFGEQMLKTSNQAEKANRSFGKILATVGKLLGINYGESIQNLTTQMQQWSAVTDSEKYAAAVERLEAVQERIQRIIHEQKTWRRSSQNTILLKMLQHERNELEEKIKSLRAIRHSANAIFGPQAFGNKPPTIFDSGMSKPSKSDKSGKSGKGGKKTKTLTYGQEDLIFGFAEQAKQTQAWSQKKKALLQKLAQTEFATIDMLSEKQKDLELRKQIEIANATGTRKLEITRQYITRETALKIAGIQRDAQIQRAAEDKKLNEALLALKEGYSQRLFTEQQYLAQEAMLKQRHSRTMVRLEAQTQKQILREQKSAQFEKQQLQQQEQMSVEQTKQTYIGYALEIGSAMVQTGIAQAFVAQSAGDVFLSMAEAGLQGLAALAWPQAMAQMALALGAQGTTWGAPNPASVNHWAAYGVWQTLALAGSIGAGAVGAARSSGGGGAASAIGAGVIGGGGGTTSYSSSSSTSSSQPERPEMIVNIFAGGRGMLTRRQKRKISNAVGRD